jgi:thiamine transport system ATP-binding protein
MSDYVDRDLHPATGVLSNRVHAGTQVAQEAAEGDLTAYRTGPAAGLAVEGVTVRFGSTVAVDQVSLRVEPGAVVAVLGPSGCGKSTLLRAVAGLDPLAAGSVRFDGVDLGDTPTHRRGFAMMFQEGQLFMHTDVAGNVGYALRRRGVRGKALAAQVDSLLAVVDLAGYAARRPATLSGGEQQRVALARALGARPRLLLLDEPLSALDRSLRERLAVDLRTVLTSTGTSALLVTHDHDEAFTVADRMAVMRSGRIVQEGPTAQVWRHPADADTARFLGYATILRGDAAARFAAYLPVGTLDGGDGVPGDRAAARIPGVPLAGPRALALRRGTLRADPAGPITATVRSVAAGAEALHIEVDIDGLGVLPARADQDTPLRSGDPVRLRADPGAIAVLPEGDT